MYEATGTQVTFRHRCGDVLPVATCAFTGDAIRIAAKLNRARYLNDVKRQYTAAARMIADAESIPQVTWHDNA